MGRGSLGIYPNELPGTDDFWFDFTTSAGRHYYYVCPREARKELLFDNNEMAAKLSELTREVVNATQLDLSDIKFSEDRRTFTFRYEGENYKYDRRTHGLKTVEEKKEEEEKEEEPIYSWMTHSPDKKYILYAKNHNLFVKGNKAMGMDTTEVQLTTDGVKDFSYAQDEPEGENGECRTAARWCPDSRHVYIV